MKRPLLLATVLSLAAALFAAGGPSPAPRPDSLPLASTPPSCKPGAPIRIDLFREELNGGRARIDYGVTPILDALAVDVSVAFPRGGSLRWHTPPSSSAAARGVERRGSLSADLPTDLPGVEVEIRARISIPDPDMPDGVGTYTTTRTVTWGEVDRVVEGVTEVVTAGELTLDTPATRR